MRCLNIACFRHKNFILAGLEFKDEEMILNFIRKNSR